MKYTKPFSIFDHLHNIKDLKEVGSEYHGVCPVCGDDNFKIQKTGSKAGRYACYSTGCATEDIRNAIAPYEGNIGYSAPRKKVSTKPKTPPTPPAPIPDAPLELGRLPENREPLSIELEPDPTRNQLEAVKYKYSDTQWTVRTKWKDSSKKKGYEKVIIPWHKDSEGKPHQGKGDKPWTLFGEAEAIEYGVGKVVLIAEGEKNADFLHQLGLIALSPLGADSQNEEALYDAAVRLKTKNVVAIVNLLDNDEPGI